MLSHKYKCIFVHIPKTAGKSVEQVFLRLASERRRTGALLLHRNTDPQLGPPRLAHLTASEYLHYGYVTSKEIHCYFKFAFVRNPWERMVSEYRWRFPDSRPDFKTFLFKHFPTSDDDCHLSGRDHYRHVLPQCDFVFDKDGQQLVDFIGRFENLQQDFDHVCHRLALGPTQLSYVNKSSSKPVLRLLPGAVRRKINKLFAVKIPGTAKPGSKNYWEYYDDEASECVKRVYARDISTFNYEFGVVCESESSVVHPSGCVQ